MENKAGERDEKPRRTAGLSWPFRRSPGEPALPRLVEWLGPGPPCPQGLGGAIASREGRQEKVWRVPPAFPPYTCPALTPQRGSSSVRSAGTRKGTSDSRGPAGVTPGAGRAPPAGWYGPHSVSCDPGALGGDPGWPRAEPPKEPGLAPGPRPRPAPGWGCSLPH